MFLLTDNAELNCKCYFGYYNPVKVHGNKYLNLMLDKYYRSMCQIVCLDIRISYQPYYYQDIQYRLSLYSMYIF